MSVFLEALKTKLLQLVFGNDHKDPELSPELLNKFVEAQNKFGSQLTKGAAK